MADLDELQGLGFNVDVSAAGAANIADKMARRAREVRAARLAQAPAGVNASRWLANKQGRKLSEDRAYRDLRRALRRLAKVRPRLRDVLRVYEDAYTEAFRGELAPVLDYIAAIRAQRAEAKARRKPRKRAEKMEWPTYWPEPSRPDWIPDVSELEGEDLAAWREFRPDTATCVGPYIELWQEYNGGDRMPPGPLMLQLESVCREALWYETEGMERALDAKAEDYYARHAPAYDDTEDAFDPESVDYVPDDEFGF